MNDTDTGITQGEFRTVFDGKDEYVLIDVRRGEAYRADTAIIPGACWYDPEDIANWAATLPKNAPIIAYCVHGHAVSQDVVRHLRSHGYDARYLEGGIDAWRAPAGPVVPKPD